MVTNLSVIHKSDWNTWRLLNFIDIFFCKNQMTPIFSTQPRTIYDFEISRSKCTWIAHRTWHNLSILISWKLVTNLIVIHEIDRNTWRLLNLNDIFYCKKINDTLIPYTTSHNLSFWNPWKLVHLNRTQNIAQYANFEVLKVSAV